MKNKKQMKSIKQTTFTNSNMKDQFQANSNSQNQPQIVLKMTRVSILLSIFITTEPCLLKTSVLST